ncbi:aminopeptidase O-like isoform X1 [Biomphalaria glabrata]|uniref:Aminopeptidase O-like isoform X1 n=2 Tax=Biomphalaria glabrata TaxID=6526 RepID=A0A9W3ADW9_BIOGL|nr:aminopeptidase O-like isoform X1 [Biomphalaria glabrata]XP_055885470.1 aminopeptidase O-like isoform X1 [Biomphalaria glabrata]XP_055885472.1 aminopeptidase O-like isoform X1 [Biomphalaria glabrata]XP_055885473.1 aminopeptidase O-like isoform X1 [Biomphalaria glabrata]
MEGDQRKDHQYDLPLSSNFEHVQVKHFILDLKCNFDSKKFESTMTIFCQRSIKVYLKNTLEEQSDINPDNIRTESKLELVKEINCTNCNNSGSVDLHSHKNSNIIKYEAALNTITLDCFAIDVNDCYVYDFPSHPEGLFKHSCTNSPPSNLHISQCCMKNYYALYNNLEKQKPINVTYTVSDCKITMTLPKFIDHCSQVVVKIIYRTQCNGPSLMWTLDQMQRPCVFTIGHQMNNRSLFPSQDMPKAMSTWHCNVTLANDWKNFNVITTGETLPEKFQVKDDETVYHSFNSYPMPAATFALAIGDWSSTNMTALINTNIKENNMPSCVVYSPLCLHDQTIDQLCQYLPHCFEALYSTLGSYPLKHLTIFIAPACFDSLGMACPHLLILSQSLLCPDLSMMYRVAHELCHTWFGILTGPKDWTEEWLTEGVCCYLEDKVHGIAMKWNPYEYQSRCNLRSFMKYRLLLSEISNTPEHLQTLRPNADDSVQEPNFVKNGLDPEKTVIQVHYLKGFFLLRHLEQKAGSDHFLSALKIFTNQQLGHLFSSKDFLHFIFKQCPNLGKTGLTVDQVCKDWLDSSGLPQELDTMSSELCSPYIQDIYDQVASIKLSKSLNRSVGKKSKLSHNILSLQLIPEQQVLFLDLLVEDSVTLSSNDFKELREIFQISTANPEVQHSWCELVISQHATRWLDDVRTFLIHHQSMGVYLYGELMISEHSAFQKLAFDCFSKVEKFMPEGTLQTVKSMLFPS